MPRRRALVLGARAVGVAAAGSRLADALTRPGGDELPALRRLAVGRDGATVTARLRAATATRTVADERADLRTDEAVLSISLSRHGLAWQY